MELHPFLEEDTVPNRGWWYVMTPAGECPSMRVGHTAVFMPPARADPAQPNTDTDADTGKVYLIGGANPSGPFGETFVLDLSTRSWDTVDCPGLRPRYEHAAFVPESHPRKIYVFGGANQAGNLNDVQVLDTEARSWTSLSPSGTPPAPRTHHATAALGDRLFVYSGGHAGADPVGDRQVHCYDARADAWSVLTTRGDSPKPRHGHAMAAVVGGGGGGGGGGKVLVHGGMAGTTFYDDLHVLDVDRGAWSSVRRKRTSPSARAAHGMVAHGTDVFVFGGMNREGALDDLHKLDTNTMTWTRLELQGPPPASRLDLALCPLPLPLPPSASPSPSRLSSSSSPPPSTSPSSGWRPDSGDQLCRSSGHAREVLERELKPGSASSRDSWTDVNASEAFFPIEGTPEGAAKDKKADEAPPAGITKGGHSEDGDSSAAAAGATAGETTASSAGGKGRWKGEGPRRTMMVLMVNGGMDTQGEIFDDTLVFPLQ
ncbi:uncharacterized protein LOC143289744 [Babylonia areolata]|uniref:uncharacterized protein LOC143289744 n=1 Tax=Babylonia areolata TaxID=304850 RepID=UPI003FD54529